MTQLTVSRLAEEAGTSSDTVRYYERIGLLPETERSASGYRLYGPEAVERLRFIKRAQRWADLDQCPAPSTDTAGVVTTAAWTGCAGGSAVKLVTIDGGGHTWFANGLGPVAGAVDASRVLWEFFSGLRPLQHS